MGISIGVGVGEQKGFEPCGDRAGNANDKTLPKAGRPGMICRAFQLWAARGADITTIYRLDNTLFFKLVQFVR